MTDQKKQTYEQYLILQAGLAFRGPIRNALNEGIFLTENNENLSISYHENKGWMFSDFHVKLIGSYDAVMHAQKTIEGWMK